MPLPKQHPVYKTYIELRRSAARMDDYISQFPEGHENDAEVFVSILDKLKELIEAIPKEYR